MTRCHSYLSNCQCALGVKHEDDHACVCGGEWNHQGRPTKLPQFFEDGSRLPSWLTNLTLDETSPHPSESR